MQLFHVTPSINVFGIREDGLEPMIGPRSILAGEKDPAVFCFTSHGAAADGVMNWLGEQLGEVPISMVIIDGSDLPMEIDHARCAWESRIKVRIPPSRIIEVYEI